FGERAGRNARTANAVEAVAAADEVAGELDVPPAVAAADFRRAAGEIVHAHIARLEQNLSAVGEPPLDQILHHLLLAVDGDAFADEIAEIDVVQRAAEGEIDSVVEHAFALHPRADPAFHAEVPRSLIDQPCPDAACALIAAAVFHEYSFYALAL